ncbi:chitinase [Biomphalaria glabrata]
MDQKLPNEQVSSNTLWRATVKKEGEVMTNLPPLRLRRERAVMIAYEKFKRLEEGCPVRSLVDNWQGGNRLKRNSFMHSVRELSKEVDLPQNRAALALHGASSPANAPGVPEVRKSLIDPEVNKKCTKTVLRNTARKTVAQYPADSIKVYTDGSTRENLGQKTSGYGVVVRFPGSTENDEILGACSGRSNYVAEMVAIQNAVEYIEERLNEKTAQPSPIVLFTDSLSSLQAIESPADTLPEPLAKTLACVGRLQEKIRTTFQYVHLDTWMWKDIMKAFKIESQSTGQSRLLLSAAVAACKDIVDKAYEISLISKVFDYINLMSYDFYGSWDNATGHVSPLYPPNQTVDETEIYYNLHFATNYWVNQGLPREKLVVGLITYGRSFTLKSPNLSGLKAPVKGPGVAGEYTRYEGILSFYEIYKMIQNGGKVRRLDNQMVPYMVYNNQWVAYEDSQSLIEKAKYIKRNHFAGVMIWALDMDDFNGAFTGQGAYPLTKAVRSIVG